MSTRGLRRLAAFTGTGLAQPITGMLSSKREARDHDRADRIDVLQRIERETPESLSRVITIVTRDESVHHFVHGESQHHRYRPDRNLSQKLDEVVRHNLLFRQDMPGGGRLRV